MLMYLPLDKERLCIKNIKNFTLSSNHNASYMNNIWISHVIWYFKKCKNIISDIIK